MMSKKEKIFTLVTNSISFLLFLAVLVPYGAGSISNFELIFKFVVAPILVCVIFVLNSYIKYVVGSNAYKYTSFSAYAGIFLYFVALFGYTVLVMLRTGAGSVYEISQWIILLLIFVLAACIFAILGIFINRFVIFISTKENVFLDLGLFVVLIALTAVLKSVITKHVGVAVISADLLKFVVVPAMFGLAIVLFLVFVMLNYINYNERFVYASRKELIQKWNEGREAVYKQAELDILYNLYDFSKTELGIEEIVVFDDEEAPVEEVEQLVEETVEEASPVEEPAPVEEIVEEPAPVKEVIEEVHEEVDPKLLEEVDSKINELLKLKEELTVEETEEVEEEIKTSLPEKEFKPSFADMVRYAKNLKGVTFQGNEQGTNYKFLVDKKVFLILNDNPKDYRLTFLMDLPQAAEYAQILAFSKAKSPKGIYSFKLVSKGEFDEETIKGIIKGSYEMVEIIKQRAIAEKEAEKARKAEERLQAKLAEMTEEQRVKYLARLEKKRMLEAMTPEEREQYELDQEKAKEEAKEAKLAEQKAKEEAKAAAEEEKARLAAEKEAEKARLAAEKEEEKARIAAEKEAEKARLAAEKAKEKEKARLAAEKQKAKEKEAAQKAKEKEKARLAAEKAKEKEKARLAAEKQKAKEKVAAEKAKEKEKARLAAEKQKAKEKEAAQKAKEKEKAKLAAEKQKAKEKEAAQKAKEKEKAKLAAEKQKAKEKEAAQKAKEKEKAKAAAEKAKEQQAA